MEEFLQVGVITATHGIHGEVKVFPTTDDPKRFKKLKKVLLDTGREKLELEVEGVKFFKNMVILKFKEYNDINQIEKYRKCPLLVTREHAVKLKKNEYFIADLIGLKVYTEDDAFLGTLDDVIQTGANGCLSGSDGRRKRDPDSGDPSVYSGSRCGRRPHESASSGRAGVACIFTY